MDLKQIALAGASALFLMTACGDDTGTAVETASADSTAATGESQAQDPEFGPDDAGATSPDDMADTAMPAEDREIQSDEDLLASLEGDWVSGDDDQAEMSIIDGTATMLYAGEVLSTETLDIVDNCPDAPSDASDMQLLTMTSTEAGESLCYAIISLSDERLELSSLPRGNTLTYERQLVGVPADQQ